jgi:hypothetical protein
MANTRTKTDEVPWWVWLAVLVGGVGAAATFIDVMNKPKQFTCYKCNQLVNQGVSSCPHCGAPFAWNA